MEDGLPKEDFHPTNTILNGIKVYYVIGVIGFIAFEIIRRRFQRAYYCRERSAETICPPVEAVKKQMSLFAWVKLLWTTSDEVLITYCGLDTLFYLRFLRICEKIAGVAILMSSVLFPVYYYGKDKSSNPEEVDHIYMMSMSNLGSDDEGWRFWVSLAALYVISGVTCFLLYKEYQVYITRRHEFFSRSTTQQYSVVINELPKYLRTEQTLRRYMNNLFPNSVIFVYVALECGGLEKLVKERAIARNKLEHYLALSAKTGQPVMIRERVCTGPKVDGIALYQSKLKKLNDAVEMEVRSILRNQAALAEEMGNRDVVDLQMDAALQEEENDANIVVSSENPPTPMLGSSSKTGGTMRKFTGTTSMKIAGTMRGAAFVTFNNIKAAQSAQQVLQSKKPTEMTIDAAPFVEDIVWENIGLSENVKSTWIFVSIALTTAIIFFWTIPTLAVVTLSKIDSLQKKSEWIRKTLTNNPWMVPVFEQLSPLLLSVMNALAPIIFGLLSKREGHSSSANVDSSLFNKLVCYQVFQMFLLPIIGGTLVQSLQTILDEPKELINILSQNLPQQSSYFISFIIVQTGLPVVLELLRVVPIIKAAIYQIFAPKLTPRERESPWFGLSPLSVPGSFSATDPLGQNFLMLILVLVFTPIAPWLCYFAAVYLVLSDISCRWQVLCVRDPSIHTTATYFPSLFRFSIYALVMAQVVMLGLLSLKQAALCATLTVPLLFATAVFFLYVQARYPRVAQNLPLNECILIDTKRAYKREDLALILDDVYKQPAMAEREPISPDYMTLGTESTVENRLSSPVADLT
jgi:hypothetical protein